MLLLQASRRAIAPAAAFSTCAPPLHNYLSRSTSSSSPVAAAVAAPTASIKNSKKTSSLFVSTQPTATSSTNQTSSSSASSTSFSTMATTSDDASSANEQQQQQQYPIAMSEAERYLFDLNGYIIIRDVLTPDQIAAAHAAIDAHLTDAIPRSDPTLRKCR